MEELEEVDKSLKEAISELNELREDEEVQELLNIEELAGKPSIFTHPLADIIRELNLNEEIKKQNEENDEPIVEEEKPRVEEVEEVSKFRKPSRRSTRITKSPSRISSGMPSKHTSGGSHARKTTSRESKVIRPTSQSIRFSQASGRKSKQIESSDGSHSGSEELIQIINITINQDLQKELKCEVGVDIFMEMPWKIISRDNVLASIKRDGEQSPFYEYAVTLQNYPEEEVLVGRATLLECDSFLVAITIPGRTLLLEEIKASHLSTWNKVMTRLNHPIGVWKSLGTEEEMDTAGIKHTRPQISFDCYIKKDYHEKLFSEGFDQVNYYTELIEDGLLMIENIEGVVFDKYTQSCPLTQESYAQTVPEIPVNSATQFTTEMRVEEFKEKLEVLDLDYEVLNEKLTGFYNKVDTLLTYNEEYDLYRDDYEILATEGEDICMYPNIPYEHYATMITFIGTKDKVITGTSWHPSQTGLVAVAYGREHIVKVGDLNDNSDEEEVDKNILYEEDLFSSFPTSNQFDEFVENLWKKQIHKLEKDMKKGKHNTTDYDLAATSTEFLLQTKHIRLFEIIQDKKRLLRMPDAEDLYKEEKFEYPLFDIAKKRKKAQEQNQSIDSIIDKVMNEKPEFLKRDYLFSGNFHWKLNLADEIINPIDLIIMKGEGTIPKQYVRTFLFPEIWGETWFFGDDLKHEAIEVNKDFRESALMALGLPTVPNSKVFLPGYKVESSIDYTLEIDFDENTKKILDEKIEKLNSGLSSKIIHRPFEVLSSCVSSHGMIENSDDEEEVDKLNLVHHVAIWSLGNDIKPMQRLISPFELTCLSFCPHNGMYLIGGTTTGQVVLWNLEGVLDHDEFQMQERSDFDLIGFKHLERVMCWFKRVRRNQTPKNRLYITAISNRVTSHMDKVIDISWLPPNVKLSPTSGKYEEVDLKDGYSLQFMSTSVDGVIKCWDLNSPPLPFSEAHINKYSFQRPGQFKLPKPPKEHGSKLKELFMRWNPFFMIRLEQRDSLSVKRFYITYISHDQAIYSYERDRTMPDKGGINIGLAHYYKVESVAIEAMNHEAVAGTIDGNIILFTWKQSGQEGTYDEQEGIGSVPVRFFKQVHDGPINKIKRHPQNNQIFLSSGGQVFGLWKIDQEEPLKWRKYADKYVTAVGWTRLRPSSFMIGLSDGCMEIWDVYVNGNEPKMTLKVTTGAIYDFVVPILPIPMGLFGITDYKGILKFYVIPWEYQFPRENEEEFFFNKVEAEHQRRLLMNEKKKSQMSLIEEETSQHSVDEKLSEDLKEKESEEIIKKKELIGCRKFKDELYKWYLRRRGKNAAWLDEAEKKWFLKEQEYMIKTILQNKKIDLKELDDAIEPLYKKEKHAKDIAVKILDVLEMADEIFKKEVQQLVLARNYHNDTQVSLEIGKMNFGELEDAMEAIDLYFGESYEKTEEELNEFVEMNPITKEWTFAELCEKNQPIRDAWNDRRRLLKKEQKWSRELIGEELDKSGYKYSCYVNHEESYIKKKYKRRVENIEHLKKTYGDDYDPYWDLHDKSGSGRNKNKSEPTKVESGMQQKFNKYADVFNVHVESPSSKHPLHEVNVVIPEGSFYRKYMPVDKKIPWEKPIPYEERVYSHSKRFKDKLGESEMSVTSESSSSKDPAHLEGEEPDYLAEVPNVTNAVVKTAPQAHDSDSEQSESSSSSSTSKDNVEKESHKESVDKSRGSVRFSEHPKAASLVAKKEPGKKGKKEIDFEKEDVTGRYHGLEDLRRLVKEKKMRGEEFIDIDDLSSYSYESVLGPISSSGSSPDMSLKSEDLLSDEAEVDDNSENEYFQEQFKEFLEETPRYDPPKVVPYDGSEYEDEPTEEWMEDDLKIALKPHDQEEESEGDEEGPKKPDIKTTAILEKEKSIRDKVQELLTMEESSDVIQTAPPMDPSGSRIERIRHPFENKCMEDINFQE
ncbi:uncharacterized protein mmm isoform X5 [Halyomorpha halys]|uniref:uncharacterized protein mmm isoform X5 n=1 Tax=Halyomorpha halys TaxID=286706 RepID=UPI0034D1CC56